MQIESIYPRGPLLIKPLLVEDERGVFFRYYCKQTFIKHIENFTGFVQYNQSINFKKGSLRGLHYQDVPYTEDKLVRCTKGIVWDVCVDLRNNSPSFLKWFGLELSAENKLAIYIPKGFAHGFITLEENCELIYHHTVEYVSATERGVRFDDPMIGIDWPITPLVISEKDQNYYLLDINFKGLVL